MKLSTCERAVFSLEEAQRAGDEWCFNCGPGALCGVLELTPEQIRPHLLDFERKGYTNPTLMLDVLKRLGVTFKSVYRSDAVAHTLSLAIAHPRPTFGLMRVQFDGPWCEPSVQFTARYRYTHWVALRAFGSEYQVFDINSICAGGWLSYREWSEELLPWLIRETTPRANMRWWATHIHSLNAPLEETALPDVPASLYDVQGRKPPTLSEFSEQLDLFS